MIRVQAFYLIRNYFIRNSKLLLDNMSHERHGRFYSFFSGDLQPEQRSIQQTESPKSLLLFLCQPIAACLRLIL